MHIYIHTYIKCKRISLAAAAINTR